MSSSMLNHYDLGSQGAGCGGGGGGGWGGGRGAVGGQKHP